MEFINTFLKDKLEWRQVRDSVAIHVPCTSKKLGVTSAFEQVAGLCAKEVTPSGIPCCGAPFFTPLQLPAIMDESFIKMCCTWLMGCSSTGLCIHAQHQGRSCCEREMTLNSRSCSLFPCVTKDVTGVAKASKGLVYACACMHVHSFSTPLKSSDCAAAVCLLTAAEVQVEVFDAEG